MATLSTHVAQPLKRYSERRPASQAKHAGDIGDDQAGWEMTLRTPPAFSPRPDLEYRDLTIRLDVREEGRNADQRAAADINPLIRYFLRRVAIHGWQPDEEVDFTTLFENDRVAYQSIEGRRWVFEVSSVTIRLSRPVAA